MRATHKKLAIKNLKKSIMWKTNNFIIFFTRSLSQLRSSFFYKLQWPKKIELLSEWERERRFWWWWKRGKSLTSQLQNIKKYSFRNNYKMLLQKKGKNNFKSKRGPRWAWKLNHKLKYKKRNWNEKKPPNFHLSYNFLIPLTNSTQNSFQFQWLLYNFFHTLLSRLVLVNWGF